MDSKISYLQDIISAGYSVEITSFIGPQECGTNWPEILQIVGYRLILRWARAKFSNTLDKFKSGSTMNLRFWTEQLVYPEILRICCQFVSRFRLNSSLKKTSSFWRTCMLDQSFFVLIIMYIITAIYYLNIAFHVPIVPSCLNLLSIIIIILCCWAWSRYVLQPTAY